MHPTRSYRAGSSAKTTISQARPFERNRGSESPIYLASAALVTPEEAKQSRERFFDALGSGNLYPGMEKAILSADQLAEVQLKKCFDVLHACGAATDDRATLETTRASVDGFLDAVFNEWGSDKGRMQRPELDFMVEAEIDAGFICTSPDQHADYSACKASNTCKTVISAAASYHCNPAMLKMEFTKEDPFTGQPESFCPLGRTDIRWERTQWRESLRQKMEAKLLSKIHRYNKYLAVWHARNMIHDWSKGSVSLGLELRDLGFLGRNVMAFVLGYGEGSVLVN